LIFNRIPSPGYRLGSRPGPATILLDSNIGQVIYVLLLPSQ